MKNDISKALKSIFGFTEFRPNQENIVKALLEKRDVFAVMPTGGGKSLCYQLPAYLLPGTCLVVSPLISLMKDQVDAACENGLKAAFLNSSMTGDERDDVMRQLTAGELDLIYAAPERFALSSFINTLKNIDLSFVAVDEAHCISEWGHDFRPDYLSLSQLVQLFPDVPVAAFTATATNRVQGDIIRRLNLRDPFTVRASFNRPNLFYKVETRDDTYGQIMDCIRKHKGESGIIYRTTRKSVEETAAWLQRNNVNARPYHAGLDDEVRKANQEAFNKDETDVIVATIAFGMGIDKSNVRFVLHADLPKNMEGYYQETGRAGRDGEPADCLLLFGYGDIPKIRYFIDPIEDGTERQKALDNLNTMVNYASVNTCRRIGILAYFDEEYGKESCGACDICTGDVERIDATVDAQKVISTVIRTGSRFGGGHVVDVLTGANTKRIRQFGHTSVTTYGIGKDKDKNHWRRIIGDLVAQGYLGKSDGQYPVLVPTQMSNDVLQGQVEFMTLYRKEPVRRRAPAGTVQDCNPELFEELRRLRMKLAKKKGVPPFVVFSDRTLREMAAVFPVTEEDMLRISGVGGKKMDQYGDVFMDVISTFVESNPDVADGPAPVLMPVKKKRTAGDSERATLELLQQGMAPEDIARTRELSVGTVFTHVEKLYDRGDLDSIDAFIDEEKKTYVSGLFADSETGALGDVVQASGETVSYHEARLVRAWMNRNAE